MLHIRIKRYLSVSPAMLRVGDGCPFHNKDDGGNVTCFLVAARPKNSCLASDVSFHPECKTSCFCVVCCGNRECASQ